MPEGGEDRVFFPSVQRAELVSLACTPPIDVGLPISRWTQRDLADYAAESGLVRSIHQTTVGSLLNQVELRPHRTEYWLTSQDPDFKAKASNVLNLYERAWDLAAEDVLVLCVDEKPNFQCLTRPVPDLPPAPGLDRRRDFHYRRHGTINLLMVLDVASGRIWVTDLPRTDSVHFIKGLESILDHFGGVRRLELIMDNASSHCSKQTMAWYREHQQVLRPHFTPTRASWLNQAELAIGAYMSRYFKGQHFPSPQAARSHIPLATEDYNTRYAAPFAWSFTNQELLAWLSRN